MVEPLPALAFESYALTQKTIKEFETHTHEVGARRVGAIGKLAKGAGVPFAALVATIPMKASSKQPRSTNAT